MHRLLVLSPVWLCLALLPRASDAQPLAVGELVVADDGADAIVAVDPVDGTKRVIASGGNLVAPHAVAVDPATLRVYVADREAGTGPLGAILRIDPAAYNAGSPAANQQVVAMDGQLEEPLDVFVERSGTLLVADGGGLGGVIRVDPRNGAQTRVFDFPSATGVAEDLAGTVYATRSIGANEIRRQAAGAGTTELVSSGGFFNVNGHLAFEPDGTLVVVDLGTASAIDGQVIRVDPDLVDTGHPEVNQSLLSDATDLVDPRGVAVGADGTIYVSDPAAVAGAGAIIAVNPETGAQALVAAGTPLDSPLGIDVARPAPQRGDIAVAETNPSSVVLVDPDTSAQRLVRSFAPMFAVDVDFDANGDLLVLLAAGGSGLTPRVVRTDPVTGLTAPVHIGGPTPTNDFSVVEKMVRDGTHLFVADSGTFVSPTNEKGAIFDVNLGNGTKTLVTGGGTDFRVLSIGIVPSDGDFVVGTGNSALDSFDFVRVDRVNLARDVVTSDGDLIQPFDIAVTPDSSTAYVAARTGGLTGAVVAVDLGTEDQLPITDPGDVQTPAGIAFDAAGDLLVTHRKLLPSFAFEGQVLRIDPDALDPTPVVVTADGLLDSPEGLAVFAPEPAATLAALVALGALAAVARLSPSR